MLIFNAFADPVIQTAASADFKYDSKSGKLTVTAETKRDETVVIDKSSFDGPSTVGLYGIDKEITTLNGKLQNSDSMNSLIYEVKDVKGNVVKSGDIAIAAQLQSIAGFHDADSFAQLMDHFLRVFPQPSYICLPSAFRCSVSLPLK